MIQVWALVYPYLMFLQTSIPRWTEITDSTPAQPPTLYDIP